MTEQSTLIKFKMLMAEAGYPLSEAYIDADGFISYIFPQEMTRGHLTALWRAYEILGDLCPRPNPMDFATPEIYIEWYRESLNWICPLVD